MPQSKNGGNRDEVARQFVEVALDDAYALREEYSQFVDRRRANREQLRSLAAQGKLSDEQLTELDELYPPRAQKAQEAEESAVAAA